MSRFLSESEIENILNEGRPKRRPTSEEIERFSARISKLKKRLGVDFLTKKQIRKIKQDLDLEDVEIYYGRYHDV